MGQLGKVYLTLFETLSPTIQDNFMYGAYDAVKSLVVGILLAIFKVTATYELRKQIIDIFKTIEQHKKDIDGSLKAADLNPLPDYMIPSFEDLNNLQTLMDDPAFLCSKEHQELVKNINQSNLLNVLLQMARIPVKEQFIQWKCDGKPAQPFVKELADRQRKPNKKKTVTAESSLSTEPSVSTTPIAAESSAITNPVTKEQSASPVPGTIVPETIVPGTSGGKRGLRMAQITP
jgi:hypothetical protein